jgi:hypothetical protein
MTISRLNQGVENSGLVHIETQSVTNVAAASFNNVFSGTYNTYKIIINGQSAGGGTHAINFRLRASGSDNSTTNYHRQRLTVSDTTLTGLRSASQNLFEVGNFRTQPKNIVLEVGNPFNAIPTTFHNLQTDYASDTLSQPSIFIHNGDFSSSTIFDGFSVLSASNFTGFISVFGYRK